MQSKDNETTVTEQQYIAIEWCVAGHWYTDAYPVDAVPENISEYNTLYGPCNLDEMNTFASWVLAGVCAEDRSE